MYHNNETKLGEQSNNEKETLSLCWDIKELEGLTAKVRKIRPSLNGMIGLIRAPNFNFMEQNFPRKLGELRGRLTKFTKGVYQFHRTVATHMFVIMISSESRTQKPYALPVQCLPYAGLKEKDIRQIVSTLLCEMRKRKMKVCGKFFVMFAFA